MIPSATAARTSSASSATVVSAPMSTMPMSCATSQRRSVTPVASITSMALARPRCGTRCSIPRR